jgi:hypothetical protein
MSDGVLFLALVALLRRALTSGQQSREATLNMSAAPRASGCFICSESLAKPRLAMSSRLAPPTEQ